MQYTLTRITHYLIMIVGAVVAFQFIGIDLTGLAIIVGFLSVGIGFGLQNITSNFVAGLILLLERPIKSLGMHSVRIVLHPELSVTITANVAQSAEEADMQARGIDPLRQRDEEENEAERIARDTPTRAG